MNVLVSSSPFPRAHPPRSKPFLRSSDAAPFPCITPSMVTWVMVVSFMVVVPLPWRPHCGRPHPCYEHHRPGPTPPPGSYWSSPVRICLPCFRASPLTRRSRPRHEHSASEYAPGPELRHRLAGPQRCGPGEVVEIAGLAGAGPGELHRLGANTMLGAGEPPQAGPELQLPGAEIEVPPAALDGPGIVAARGLEAAERAAQSAVTECHRDHHTGGRELDLADPDARQVQQARECSGGAHRCPPGGSVEAFRRVRHRSRHSPRRPDGRTPPLPPGTTSAGGRLPMRRRPTWRSRLDHPIGTHIYADRPFSG